MMSEAVLLNAKQAIAKHVNWRIVLQFAVTMEEELTPEQMSAIQHHRECAIGRWLDSPVNLRMRQHPTYRELVSRHVQFHKEMIIISELIAAKRFVEAAARLSIHSSFTKTGNVLAQMITAFDQVSKIVVPL